MRVFIKLSTSFGFDVYGLILQQKKNLTVLRYGTAVNLKFLNLTIRETCSVVTKKLFIHKFN